MGVAVSSWRLAQAVARTGQLGVISGTALAMIVARRLQIGDPGGHMREALGHFPVPGVADRILKAYYIPGGKRADAPFKSLPIPMANYHPALTELTVAANFVEVFLAKQGHDGVVGINLLEKVQMPTLPSLFGAMLAGVDYVLMGAGIPRAIPGVLDLMSSGKLATLKLDGEGYAADQHLYSQFDPPTFCGTDTGPILKRPYFLAVVSSAVLAATLARKSSGKVDGFVVETSAAGGHNAPPRGALQVNERGEPIYGERDAPDFAKYRELGLPYWMAGSYGRTGGLAEALAVGALGIQVGTAFAFCEESGIEPELKQSIIESARTTTPDVMTDRLASPTGFPLKVVQIDGTISDEATYAKRDRICDIGYLRTLYRKPDGSTGYRCAAEPVEDYVRKGGEISETVGRKCICNCLTSAAGLGQVLGNGEVERPLVTAGDHLGDVVRFLRPGTSGYTAADVVRSLLDEGDQVTASSSERSVPART